jgi:lipopolysaccharide transport system ATP-binding protein
MGEIAIRCEGLGKRYRIGAGWPGGSFRHELAAGLARLVTRRGARRAEATTDPIVWALRDVSVDVAHGDVVGVVGRNGAGKSTLLKILSRITAPTEGRATVHGRVGSLLEVGTGFHPELTGRDNVYLNGVILGMRRGEIDRKFDEIVAFAEVERFIDTPVKHYSSGMAVRLAFAVAAHLDTEILLVDEVLAVGDTQFQRKCLGKMGDLSRAGRTVLFVSHSMVSLGALCRSGLLLEAGRIVRQGPIGDVVATYLASVASHSGEVGWPSPEVAPGDDRVRLKAVRIVCAGTAVGDVDIAKDFEIEVWYWNLQPNARRMVSVHLHTAAGVCVLTSGNLPSVSSTPDAWVDRPYPIGLFRTVCTVPGGLLNDGLHSVSVFINGSWRAEDNVVVLRDALAFEVRDGGEMRKEYFGPWLGAVRPRLAWQTERVE